MALVDKSQMKLLKKLISKKPSKYRNVKTTVDGIRFDSKKEAMRWLELKSMEQRGEIGNLARQTTVEILVNGLLICKWIADFTYTDARGIHQYEDTKGVGLKVKGRKRFTTKTEAYRIKKKLLLAVYGITIKEV